MFWRKREAPPEVTPVYSEPDAAPDYLDANPTYAPKLGQTQPTHGQVSENWGRSKYPKAGEAPEEFYLHNNAASYALGRAEYLQGDEGLPIPQDSQPAPYDVRRNPVPPNDRYTSHISPSSYRFWRPFDQATARDFNGNHFSMADHKREYEIYGMQPVVSRRNTYRAEPAPWDLNIVDKSADIEPDVREAVLISPDVPPNYGPRNWRLG